MVLQKLTLTILYSRSCENSWRKLAGTFRADPDQLCAVSQTRDLCEGDKGSGLVVADCSSNSVELLGVTSFSHSLPSFCFLPVVCLSRIKKSGPIPGCNTTLQGEKLPVVLGKVSSILKWIEEKTSDAASTTTCRKQSPTKPTSGSYQCQVCGQPEATVKKVIGGRDAEPGEYPWAALVLIDNKYREGLSLDTELYLRSWLTSAGETRSKCPSSMY